MSQSLFESPDFATHLGSEFAERDNLGRRHMIICWFAGNTSRIILLVTTYDPKLPISFHCSNCKRGHQLRGEEAAKQTPLNLVPQFLSFKCPGCQTVLKARVEQGHWVNDMSGRKSSYVLDQTEIA